MKAKENEMNTDKKHVNMENNAKAKAKGSHPKASQAMTGKTKNNGSHPKAAKAKARKAPRPILEASLVKVCCTEKATTPSRCQKAHVQKCGRLKVLHSSSEGANADKKPRRTSFHHASEGVACAEAVPLL